MAASGNPSACRAVVERTLVFCALPSSACLPALSIIALPANAAPAATVEAVAQEIVGLATSSGSTLQTRVLRPPGSGPFPLAIVSHGSPADAAQRPNMEIPTFASVSNWLLARGYMVALPLRRGYGQTGGPWLENFGSCGSPDYHRAGLTTAEDIRTVIDYFRGRTEVQRDRILLIGWSAGGRGSLAAASQVRPAYLPSSTSPRSRRRASEVGNWRRNVLSTWPRATATARIPTLAALCRQRLVLSAPASCARCPRLSSRGWAREYVALPAFGSDGTGIPVADARALWQPPVEKFLGALKP